MARQPGTYAILDTTQGTIVCRLFEKDAPKTVQNFIELAEGTRDWQDRGRAPRLWLGAWLDILTQR